MQFDGAVNGPGFCNASNTRGLGLGADTRFSTQTNTTEDLSLNAKWTVNDRIGLSFDIPKGQKLVRLELHDSSWSGGVSVTVNP